MGTTVEVYVRKADGGRFVSFVLPPDIPQKEVLDRGFAVDGNAAAVVVKPTTGVAVSNGSIIHFDSQPSDGWHEIVTTYPTGYIKEHGGWTLTDALAQVEQMIVGWLGGHGYEVVFK